MKRLKPEIIPGDRQIAKSWLIVMALYLLFLVWLEPLIDFILMQMPLSPTAEGIAALNNQKRYMSSVVFGVARSLPIMLFLWLGWQIVQAQRLPPRGIRLPVAVLLVEGRKAVMIGMVIVVVAIMLLSRELVMLVSA